MSYEDFLNQYSPQTEVDTLSPFDQFLIDQQLREQKEKEERLRLEEENRIKEAERKAAEVEAARLKVEELAFDPNAPQFVKAWATKLIEKLRTKVSPRDLL